MKFYNKKNTEKKLASVANEKGRYWSHACWRMMKKQKKLMPLCPKRALGRRKRKKWQKMTAFCVTRKRNKLLNNTKN